MNPEIRRGALIFLGESDKVHAMDSLTLLSPIQAIPGVGPILARRFQQLGITTCEELLWHLPSRYEDFRNVSLIRDVQPNTTATIRARVDMIQNKRSFRKRMMITEGLFSDATGTIKAIWFRQPFITKNLLPGQEVFLSGKVTSDAFGLQFSNPTYERVSSAPTHTARLVPIYPTTEKLSQKQLRYAMSKVLPLTRGIHDPLPESICASEQLCSLSDALRMTHAPSTPADVTKARERLGIQELLIIHLANAILKKDLTQHASEPIPFAVEIVQSFVRSLPFTLTDAQRKVAWQILQDLERTHPMNRLLEGDVGSGKTVVAAIAAVNVTHHRKQVAYMAPTEILAQQQYHTMQQLLPDQRVALLTSHQSALNDHQISKPELKRMISGGDADVVVGTHALLSEDVRFIDLGLTIIDEQHRFGVKQRKMLRRVSGNPDTLPHLLSMTATPIPRTLALALFGDLDLSIIDELPSNRQPIQTERVRLSYLVPIFDRVKQEIAAGHQVFVVCPLIEESDVLRLSSAEQVYDEWSKGPFQAYRVALLHGRLKADEKERIMAAFQQGEIDVLVSTAVIEVGVDIPNATVMMIRGAERFGLAQLHQFRGRIGRGADVSYCFVIPDDDDAGKERIEMFIESRNGFELAEFDLKTRGPGEVYGTRQSGIPDLKVATLSDYALIQRAHAIAQTILQQDPTLEQTPELKQRVHQFLENLHLE